MDEQHFRLVAKSILEAKVVPFLGAGVNLLDRSPGQSFEIGHLLPNGAELAHYLADVGEIDGNSDDLAKVSQNFAMLTGGAALYDELREVFNHDYPPTSLHRFLAEVPALMRRAGAKRYQFIVTTNFDYSVEQAFDDAGEPYDVVTYIADGDYKGKFLHRAPDGSETIVLSPNSYDRLSLEARPVIAKIHGTVDRSRPDNDSYVITEDHYIDYLSRTDISQLIPVKLVDHIKRSHFLFLGYSLRDWNLRVILHRIWGSRALQYKSWAVQQHANPLEQQSWAQRDVQILEMPLDLYLAGLRQACDAGLLLQ